MHDLTDHLPNFIILNKFSSLPSNVKIYRRDYSALNESDLIDDFQYVDWQTVLQANTCNDPTEMFDLFSKTRCFSKTSEIIDKHIPVKELSKKELKLK